MARTDPPVPPIRWRRFAAAFVATLVGIEIAARVLAPSLDPVYDWPRHDYENHETGLAARADDLDVLVVGSSIAGRAISPDGLDAAGETGHGYNYWLAGPPMRSITLLTTDVLLERTAPELVIIGVSMREFNDGPVALDHVRALGSSPAFRAATGQSTWINELDGHLRTVSVAARHRHTLRDPAALLQELREPSPVPELLAADGFMAERGANRLADETAEHILQEQQVMADYRVSTADLDALAALLSALRQRDVPALVVNLPVTDQFIELADDDSSDYQDYLHSVHSITVAQGGHWLDAQAEIDWSDADFGDINHLNDQGTERLQPLLLDALAGIPRQ